MTLNNAVAGFTAVSTTLFVVSIANTPGVTPGTFGIICLFTLVGLAALLATLTRLK